jgi:thiosulfate/3-mercaptopyruvate sulfurtransferase
MSIERRVRWPLSLSAVLLTLPGCAPEVGSGDGAVTDAVPAVLVDTEWVEAHLGDPEVRIVEVGGAPRDYAEGHLPGAVFLGIGSLSNPDDPVDGTIATREQLSDALSAIGARRGETLVLYDRQRSLNAARAYWALKYYGHPEIRVYDGGAARWTADGRSMSAESPTVAGSEYQAGPADPDLQTSWQWVVDHVDDPSTLTCDVRGPNEYLGRDVRAARGGHIPGSINVEWTAAVNGDQTFKSAAELRVLYTAAGFTPDKQIITYCQTGVRGAHTWFVLSELLGYPNVRNYDGSWAEYGNNPESPIES